MPSCDACGGDVPRVWKRRVRDACMTHRRTRRVCADCHPFVSNAPEDDRIGDVAVTDGGTETGSCPDCTAPTTGARGPRRCVECGWVGYR